MRLDLFNLHNPEDNVNQWILTKGKNLKFELKKIINKLDFTQTELVKYLMKRLDISITTAERLVYLKKEWYPLIFIKEIANMISVEKKNFGKKKSFGSIIREIYIFNENIQDWRLPERFQH